MKRSGLRISRPMLLRCLPALFLLFACLAPGISAYVVTSVDVAPAGYQAAGTPMTVTCIIDFPNKGANVTFLQDHEMRFGTDLTHVSWQPEMNLDGLATGMDPTSGSTMSLSGWYLSYPAYQDLRVTVVLKGNIPDNPSTGMKILKIDEIDPGKNVVSTASVAMPEAPIMTFTPAVATTPVKKPTTLKKFTPIPTDTPTPESPTWPGASLVALMGVALFAMRQG